MRFIIALLVSLLLIALCAVPLKRHPVPFYLAAIGLSILYAYGVSSNATQGFWSYFMALMQRCTLAFMLFSIVMFIGVLDERSKLKVRLMPLRRQLSILACIFACSHIAYYAASYVPRLLSTSALSVNVIASLGLSALLVMAMAILLVTSFVGVKANMAASVWKKVQRLAYPFYIAIYVHLALLLLPSALAGKDTAVAGLVVFTFVFASYAAFRIRRHILDSRRRGVVDAPMGAVSATA